MAEQDDVPDEVTAVARRYGVNPPQVKEVLGGVANRAFVLGANLFLRISRPGFERDLLKETQVVPLARSVGVLTPEIVEYDDTHELIDAPYVVMQRIHGVEPTTVPAGLAEQLAKLHQLHQPPPGTTQAPPPGTTQAPPPGTTQAPPAGTTQAPPAAADAPAGGEVGVDGWGDPWGTVEDLVERGYVDAGTGTWLADWFKRLAERIDGSGPNVLIHGDVAAHNLLAGPQNELRALIDWGDAAWAPPAMDFAKLPLTDVALILPTYLHHTRSPAVTAHPTSRPESGTGHSGASGSEEEFAAAVLWFHLSWALAKLPADPWPGQRHWTAPTTSRLLGVLQFFTSSPPAPWSELV